MLSLFRVTGGLELASASLYGNLSGIWLTRLDSNLDERGVLK
jgi:hypothetical protein